MSARHGREFILLEDHNLFASNQISAQGIITRNQMSCPEVRSNFIFAPCTGTPYSPALTQVLSQIPFQLLHLPAEHGRTCPRPWDFAEIRRVSPTCSKWTLQG